MKIEEYKELSKRVDKIQEEISDLEFFSKIKRVFGTDLVIRRYNARNVTIPYKIDKPLFKYIRLKARKLLKAKEEELNNLLKEYTNNNKKNYENMEN